MASIEQARKDLGQLFLIGFTGLELSDDTSAFLSQAGIGGVVLFAANYESPGQLAELVNQVQECRSDLPLLVAVDHEGGRVQRFKKGFTRIPDAATIGQEDSPKLAFAIAEIMAKELKAVGINVNLIPVADILTNQKNSVIGNRAFGSNEEIVSKMTSAFVRGHLVNGVQPCIKHFPGHGDTSTDSHLALPRVETPLEVLMEREFRPFQKAVKSHCSMVMTAHIVNMRLDPKHPATLSPIMIRDILRKQLRYSRVVVTDDMEMKAITDHFGPEEAPRLAVEAGCDLLLFRSEAGARRAYEALLRALEDGKLSPDMVVEAAGRIRTLKKDMFKQPYQPIAISELGKKVGTPEHLSAVQKFLKE